MDEKTQTKIVAKALDKLVEDLVSVQPMTASVGQVFRMKTTYRMSWGEWCRKIIILPRRSIYGKLVVGIINRSSRDEFDVPFGAAAGHPVPKRFHRYASDKELFLAKLEGEA